VIIAGSVSDEEAKGLFGQWKPARVPEVGRPDSNRVEPHVSDLRIYRRFGRAHTKLADQTMIICVRGAIRRLRTCLLSLVSLSLAVSRDPVGGSVDQVDDHRRAGLLTLIAATVSYLYMHVLVAGADSRDRWRRWPRIR